MTKANGAEAAARFVWYDLMTTDVAAAEGFYRSVLGWNASTFEGNDLGYRVLSAGTRGVGGLMALCDEAAAKGAKPGWCGYLAVADVDAATRSVTGRGGRVYRQPEDIPDVGRFSVVADPQGAVFMLFAPRGAGEPPATPGQPGTIAWHELHTSDWEAAFGFYAREFGWVKHEPIDMGPMGTYQLFGEPGGDAMGGMFNSPAQPPHWLFYAAVEGIDSARKRIGEGGGTVMHGPQEVPGGRWIVQACDPQGAMFAIVGPRG